MSSPRGGGPQRAAQPRAASARGGAGERADLRLELWTRWLGLRFVQPETERRYRAWRVDTAAPFATVGYVGSAPSWLLSLVAIGLIDPDTFPRAVVPMGGWVVVLVVLTALARWPAARRWTTPLAAVANGVAGCLIAWLCHDVLLPGFEPAVRSGVMVGGVLVVMLFGFATFRLTPPLAVMAVTPYLLLSAAYLSADGMDDGLDPAAAAAYTAVLVIAYLGGLLVCTVGEVITRRAFAKDRIIQAQNEALSESQDLIRRYVPPAVAERIVRGEGASVEEPARRRVTVLFSDVVGFTDLADRVDPEVVTEVVAAYMAAMADVVEAHGGTVTEFLGDGVMALFGAPTAMDPAEQARQAVAAAQAMHAALPELNRRWRRDGLPADLAIRIGINTGRASVGTFGSRGRATYTAIGLQSNIAARLQSHCEPGGILMTDATYQLLDETVACEPRGEVALKGLRHPVAVHALVLPTRPLVGGVGVQA